MIRKHAPLAALIVLSAFSVSQAQAQKQGLGGSRLLQFSGTTDPLISLVQSGAVLKELEAGDDQKQQLKKILDDSRSERLPVTELSAQEREKAFAEFRERMRNRSVELRQKIEEVLRPEQLDRLREISLQRRGVRAFADESVAAELNLDEKQRGEITATQQEMANAFRKLFQGGQREDMRQRMTELCNLNREKMLAILTDEQKEQFEQMKGEPFEMPARRFSRRGQRSDRDSNQSQRTLTSN